LPAKLASSFCKTKSAIGLPFLCHDTARHISMPALLALIKTMVTEFSDLEEVWLLGSRANHTATEASDWDLLIFPSANICRELNQRADLRPAGLRIDCLVVWEQKAERVWCGKDDQKSLDLRELEWSRISDDTATYKEAPPWLTQLPEQHNPSQPLTGSRWRERPVKNAYRIWP
jgi:predicted nucleotidyltransferase